MSTRCYESAIISKPIGDVWAAIRNLDFAFSSSVANTELDGKIDWDEVGGVRRVSYTDKTVQTYRLLELSDANRSLSFELVSSIPSITYMAVNTTWKLKRITHDNTTLFESVSDFSKDASGLVLSDAKYKKLDQFRDLRAYLAGGISKRTFGLGGRESVIPPQGVPGTKHERSFIAVKPDGVQRGLIGEIIGRFEKRGYKLVAMKLVWPTKEKAEGHYDDLKSRDFFPHLVKFFSSGPVCAMVWEGAGVIAGGRKLLGETSPAKSAPGTIRGDFAIDVGRNICHGSDGPSGAAREINFWFSPCEICDWCSSVSSWIYEK